MDPKRTWSWTSPLDERGGPTPSRSLTRSGNLLGALALVVTDRMSDAIPEASGVSGSAAIALSALYHFLDEPTIDTLRRVLGLTSSGAVRLVDRLEEGGFVRRGPAEDGRATSVLLTADGRRVARRISRGRAQVLENALSVLEPEEREQWDQLVSRVLVGLMRSDSGAVRWMCRLCDMDACGWRKGRCPVRNAWEVGPRSGQR